MDTYLAIASKRDWRSYSDRPIPEEVQRRILDAGRLAGSARNSQPWSFFVFEDRELAQRVAETVYAADNVLGAALVVVVVAADRGQARFDAGRAVQNMFLAAWNEGVVSCPNGMPEPARTAQALGLQGDEQPLIVLSFGYPAKPRDPDSRSAEEWSKQANRKPLDELVQHL